MAVLAGLAAICGAGNAREAGPHDAVAGVTPKYVAAPGCTEEVAAVLRLAADQALTVVPRGTGTKLAWGAPPRSVDLVLDTTRLARVVEHAAGDLVVVVEAGTRLDTLQETLAAHGQRLALDPPSGARSGARSPPTRPGRSACSTAPRATCSSGSRWCARTGWSPERAARWSRTSPGTTWGSCSPARTGRSG